MVNQAYLNRLNTALIRCHWHRTSDFRHRLRRIRQASAGVDKDAATCALRLTGSVRDEAREIDGLYPIGVGIDHQRADRERDAVGDAAVLGMQPCEPLLPGQLV